MVLPQQTHYISKLTSKSRIGGMSTIEDDFGDGKKDAPMTRSRLRQSPIMTTSVISNSEKEGIPLESLIFSTVNQVRLNFFDQIVVWSPYNKDVSLSASCKRWIEGVVNGLQTLANMGSFVLMQKRQ